MIIKNDLKFVMAILVLPFFFSCMRVAEKEEIISRVVKSDIDFSIYVEKFYRDLEFHGIYKPRPETLIIELSRFDQDKNFLHNHARSYGVNNDKLIEIYINSNTWKNINEAQKYLLIYHELGHDVLNLADLPEEEKFKNQLMYPSMSKLKDYSMDDFIESMHKEFEKYGLLN